MSRVKKLEDEIFHINTDLKKSERKYEVTHLYNFENMRSQMIETKACHMRHPCFGLLQTLTRCIIIWLQGYNI